MYGLMTSQFLERTEIAPPSLLAGPERKLNMQVMSFSQARADLKQTMDDVCRDHEPAVITRQRGEPVVMLSLDDYNGLRETMYLLGSPANAKRLRESIDQLRSGKAVTKEFLIDEHPEAEE